MFDLPHIARHGSGAPESCAEFQPLLMLSAAGEDLSGADREKLSGHLEQCPACAAELAHQAEFLSLVSAAPIEPDATLLAQCRAGLTDALDREEERGWLQRAFGTWLPANWFAPRPAWSAALLLLLGFSVGAFGPRLIARHFAQPAVVAGTASGQSDANVAEAVPSQAAPDPSSTADTNLGSLDLHTADVAGINVFPSGDDEPPQVQLQMRAQQPIVVQGTVNNDDVKRVLCYVLRNSDRFDPDVRLSAVDLLRSRNNNSDVRSALCYAVHSDPNAAVRLKALEALNGAEPQGIIRQTLLDALVDDENPGVRIEAINELRGMAADGQVVPDDHMLSVLHNRMERDPNNYVRLQSAAAIRDLGQH